MTNLNIVVRCACCDKPLAANVHCDGTTIRVASARCQTCLLVSRAEGRQQGIREVTAGVADAQPENVEVRRG